ncbi:tRNA (guanine-N(7)-)-methyltransferase non-catalytic subunit wdr4 [Tanacetum coccineum]
MDAKDPVGYALVEIIEGSDMKPSDMNGTLLQKCSFTIVFTGHDRGEEFECDEETYYPALNVGTDKTLYKDGTLKDGKAFAFKVKLLDSTSIVILFVSSLVFRNVNRKSDVLKKHVRRKWPCVRPLPTSSPRMTKDVKSKKGRAAVTVFLKKPLDGAHEIHSFCLGHTEFVFCLAFIYNQDCPLGYLVFKSGDSTVRLWDHTSGLLLHTYEVGS